MSRENVEIVRGNLAALKRSDWKDVAATYDPNILIRTDPRWPETCVFGREAAIRWYQGLEEAGGTDIYQEEIIDCGDRLVVRERWNIHGQQSGLEGAQQSTATVTFRAGRIILIEYYLDHDQALEVLGLRTGASVNLDFVRSIYADWERGDYSATSWAHPEMEYVIADGPDPVSGRGVAGMGAAWREVLGAWRDYRAIPEEYRELDEGRVLVLTAFRARGRASNIEVGQVLARGASMMQIEDRHVTKLVLYFDRDRAFADLGLEG